MEIKDMTFGGTNVSHKILSNSFFSNGSKYPIVSTVTGLTRVVCATALIAFNILKILAFCFIALGQVIAQKEVTAKVILEDSSTAIVLNLMLITFGLYESIPVIGNIVAWVKLSRERNNYITI